MDKVIFGTLWLMGALWLDYMIRNAPDEREVWPEPEELWPDGTPECTCCDPADIVREWGDEYAHTNDTPPAEV